MSQSRFSFYKQRSLVVNLNREDIRTMLGGSESTERLGAKMKNQLESRGVREQSTQLRSCLRVLSGYDATPGKTSTGHLVPPPWQTSQKLFWLSPDSKFQVLPLNGQPQDTGTWLSCSKMRRERIHRENLEDVHCGSW